MPSLNNRVAHQRDTLMGRGADIRIHAERVHTRLRHPVVIIPAFVSGMLFARAASVSYTLPRLTTRLRHTTQELRELHAIVTLIATLAPILLRPRGAEADDTSATQSGPRKPGKV